jgi:hypothetical protein
MWRSIKDKLYQYPAMAIPIMIALCLLIPLAVEILPGLKNPWQLLPPPPSKPVKLLGTGPFVFDSSDSELQRVWIKEDDGQIFIAGHVYILGENGQVYTFNLIDQIWREALPDHDYQSESCDTTGPLLGKKSGQCVQEIRYDEIIVAYYRFLLDQHGNVWYWHGFPNFFDDTPSYLFCVLPGLVAGILVALILARNSRQKAKVSDEP